MSVTRTGLVGVIRLDLDGFRLVIEQQVNVMPRVEEKSRVPIRLAQGPHDPTNNVHVEVDLLAAERLVPVGCGSAERPPMPVGRVTQPVHVVRVRRIDDERDITQL